MLDRFDMLDRFLAFKNCVCKALIDINLDLEFTDDEMTLLSQARNALHPIKVTVEKLCCHNSDLYAADFTIKFMLEELSSQKTALKDSLIDQMFSYLHNPKIKLLRKIMAFTAKSKTKQKSPKHLQT
jgi:hypothetical protein